MSPRGSAAVVPAGDVRLLRRASRTVAVQTAVAVSVVLALVGLVVFSLDVRDQRATAAEQLRSAAQRADDVRDPPPGVLLAIRRPNGSPAFSSGTPADVRAAVDLRGPAGPRTLVVAAGSDSPRAYDALIVRRRDGDIVEALRDRAPQQQESRRLLEALLGAQLVGVSASAGLGLVLSRRAIRPLGRALAMQRRFVTDASHELRAPLTVLHTRAQLLQRDLSGARADPELAAQVDGIVGDTRSLGEVVEDLLVSAELGRRPYAREPVDLGELARSVVASFAAYAQQAGVHLDLAAPVRGPTVVAATAAVRRAVTALVDNAIGHVPAGGRVQVQVQVLGPRAVLRVVDDGVGFQDREPAQLSARFAAGTNAVRGSRRFGLGLSLVGEVVDAHDGSVQVSATPGGGATVTVSLPLAPGGGAGRRRGSHGQRSSSAQTALP